MALSPALQKLVSQAANKYSRSSGNRIKPKEGTNRYRILVPDADVQFWADLGVHWIKTELESNKPVAVVGCRDVVFQEVCEIDTAIDQAIASAFDEDSKKLYESWRAKKSVLLNVLDRSKGSTNPDEVQILEVTTTTFGKIMGLVQEYAEEDQDVLDPKNGIDISISRSGKGLNTEYSVNAAPGTSQPVKKEHLAGCHNLLDHINKEFFKGEETKAINAIAQIAQINVPRIGSKTPTAALTSRAAQVREEEEETVVEEDLSQDLNDEPPFDTDEEAPKTAAKQTTAAAKKTAPAPKAAAKEEVAAEAIDDSDLDDVLADLDNL
jgi:hypothetical protein